MKVQYTGKEPLAEKEYFNRVVRPGEIREIKNDAGKVLIRSRVWKEYHKPKAVEEKQKPKEGSK